MSIFKIRDKKIDIEEIRTKIRENTKKRELNNSFKKKDLKSLPVFSTGAGHLLSEVSMLKQCCDPNPQGYIVSHRPVLGRFIIFAKKALRKVLRPYHRFIFQRQLEFNMMIANMFTKIEDLSQDLTEKYEALTEKYEELHQENVLQKRRLELVLAELENKVKLDGDSTKKILEEKRHLMDHAYFVFENRYRGSQEEIRKRQEIYLPLFENMSNILDIGCGRGEFLELLKENGIEAKGIDINEDMVFACNEKGLDVKLADAISYLQNLEDDTLEGVIACQVIEHLKTDVLIEFVKLCCQKLKKGGKMILETVNPKCITTSATNFYIDLSHVKPIHPIAIESLSQNIGFTNTEVRYLSPYPKEDKLRLIKADNKSEYNEIINENFKQLNELLFGYQEYALICKK